MNKAMLSLRVVLFAVGFATMALTQSAVAQNTAPGLVIPAEAKKVFLEFSGDGQVALNGKLTQLSAAAQIRGTNNLIILSQSLRGKYTARVQLDAAGQVHRAWLLDNN